MAHIVTCIYCKKKFDRDKYPFVQISTRRYAHKECSEQENSRLKQEELVLKLLGEEYISPRVRKQINTYREEYQYTYSGIRKALVYFYEIKGNSAEKANGGIGIVPYVYKDAFNYYYAIWEANQKNEEKVIVDYIPQEQVVKIPVPQRKLKQRKLFTFLDEEGDEHGE